MARALPSSPSPPSLKPPPVGATDLLKNMLVQLLRTDLRHCSAIVIVATSGNGKSTLIGRLLSSTQCTPLVDLPHAAVRTITQLMGARVTREEREKLMTLVATCTDGPFDLSLLVEKDKYAETAEFLPPRYVCRVVRCTGPRGVCDLGEGGGREAGRVQWSGIVVWRSVSDASDKAGAEVSPACR
jgi:hypothetical protein